MKNEKIILALCVCLFLLPSITFAKDENLGAPVSLDLRSVSVAELSRLVFADMLHASYFVAPDVLSDDRKVSFTVSGLNKPKVLDTVKNAFASIGVSIEYKGGVYYVGKIAAPSEFAPVPLVPTLAPVPVVGSVDASTDTAQDVELQTYKPHYRPLAYLSKVAKFAGAKVADVGGEGGVLVYSSSAEKLSKIAALLASADSLPPSVTIKAALIEYTESNDKGQSLALDVLTKNLGLTYRAGVPLSNGITLKGATVSAVLSAIAGDSRFSYMAQPLVHVADGEKAVLSVGSDVPTRGAVSLDKNGNPLQSIEYRQSGVMLSVSPRISADTVSLSIDQQVSSFSNTTTSTIDSPTLLKRSVSTVVNARRGSLVVLAGLDDDKKTESSTGLAFLPDFLRSKSSQGSKSQVLLMLEIGEEI